MATDLERLVVRLEASLKSYENQMKKAGLIADQTAKKIETRFSTMNSKVGAIGTSFIKGFAVGGLTTLFSAQTVQSITGTVKALADLGDQADRIGITSEELQKFRYVAELTASSSEAMDVALKKFALNISDAGRGTGDFGKVLAANGISLRDQNGQLRSSTDLFGDYADLVANAKSPQDQLNLAAIAFGKRAGPDMVAVLKLGGQGFRDMAAQAQHAGAVIQGDVITRAQALDDEFTRLNLSLSNAFKGFAVEIAPAVIAALNGINYILKDINYTAEQMRKGNFGEALGLVKGIGKNSTEGAAARSIKIGATDPGMSQSDLNDFYDAVFGTKPSASDGGGDVSLPATKAQLNDYQQAVKSLKDRTAALVAETNAQAKLNPLVNDYGFAVEKARAEQDLLTAAMDAGVTITPQLRAQIEGLATGYAAVTADAARLAEQQAELQDSVAQFADIGRSALGGFISDMRDGVSAGEALANVLSNIADRMVDIALNSVFDTKGGGGIGSLIGAALSAFGGARASGGPVSAGRAYLVGERGPEFIVPRANGIVVPNAALRKAGGGGSSTVNVTVDLRGTTGDRELDAKIKTSAAAAYSQAMRDAKKNAPGWIAEHQTYRA